MDVTDINPSFLHLHRVFIASAPQGVAQVMICRVGFSAGGSVGYFFFDTPKNCSGSFSLPVSMTYSSSAANSGFIFASSV